MWGVAGFVLCAPFPVFAQPTGAPVIIVTGERTDRTITETASSVDVTSGAELDRKADIERLDRILAATPNVTLGSGGLGPTIRGQDTTGVLRDLPAFLGGNRPRTTLVIDGRPASYNEFVFGAQPLWDVARVEVFRSPQTTTQGRNSISGAIFVETAMPEHEFAAKFRASLVDCDTTQFSGSVNGPIVRDQLAVRFSGDRYRGKSASELSGGGQSVDPNPDRYDLFRGKLLLTPAVLDQFSLDLTYTHLESQAVQLEGIRVPYRERRDTFARYGVFRTNVDSLTVRPRWEIDGRTSVSGIASFGWSDIHRFAPPGLGETDIGIEDRAFEAIVRHERDTIGLVAGTSFSQVNQAQKIDLTTVRLGSGTFDDRQTSHGIFGELELRPSEDLTVTLGGRYQSDRQRRSGGLAADTGYLSLDYDREFSWFLPKFSLAYEFSDALTAGILVQKAANPGGTTLIADRRIQDEFAAETLWDFELFVRGAIADNRLRYEANLFHYAMRNAQRSVTRTIETPGGAFFLVEIGNVPRAWSRGAEFQLDWRISPNVELSGSLGLLDTKIARVDDPADPLLGRQFQRSPHLTAALDATFHANRNLSFNIEYFLRSGYFDDDLNTVSRRIGGTNVLNAIVVWKAGRFKAFAHARNLFDRFYLTSLAQTGLATAGDPREAGIGIEVSF